MKQLLVSILCVAACGLLEAADGPARPKILGVAHIALYTTDLAKTRAFFKDFLGFEEPFALQREDGTDRIAFIKINDHQYVELFDDRPKDEGFLNHISIYTDSAYKMRDYLASRGVKVPEKIGKGRTGNLNYNIKDPDGHTVEIVEYQPDSWTAREKGKFQPASRVSTKGMHVGITVGSLDASMKFYGEILGFKEFWRGAPDTAQTLQWVNMRVPDGEDYIEFMLYTKKPEGKDLGVKNHLCLMVPDINKAVAALEARPARKNDKQEIVVKVGVNRKRQANLYDPDGTRVELMEPVTVDGKPAPDSKAPAPR